MPTNDNPSADKEPKATSEEPKEHTDEKKVVDRTREFLVNLVDDNGHKKDADVNTVRFNFRFQIGQVVDIVARLQKLSGDDAEEPPVDAFSISCSKAANELINGILKDTVNNILLYSMGPDEPDLPF